MKQTNLVALLLMIAGCGGDSGGGIGSSQQELLDQVNGKFPFTPNRPFDVIFTCQRNNSQLLYTLDFKSSGDFDLYSTLNTGQDVMVSGNYSYQNDELHLQLQSNFISLDERSSGIESLFGILYRFQTAEMDCIAIGHRYNDPAREFSSTVHYSCPDTNIQATSYDNNAIEFVHRNMPFSLPVPGSAFRQRNRNISGTIQPIIQRGYGIYRRDGDNFYVYFNNLFDDVNILSGAFSNGDLEIRIDQLEPQAGSCTL